MEARATKTQAALQFRSGYLGDPVAYAGLVDLLRDTFDIDISMQDRFHGPDPTSMPFGYFDGDGRCVANFSAFSMPLIIGGRRVNAVGYQSGAVRPEFRGQGLYRDLMSRAFTWAEQQGFELGLLLTDKPALYEPHGFRSAPQHAFRGPVSRLARTTGEARPLSLDVPADVLLLNRLLAVRQPVSQIFAVESQSGTFLLNCCFDPEIQLTYLEKLEAVVAWKRIEDCLHLLDVVAARIPSLVEIASALGEMMNEILVHFPPDRLNWPEGRSEPYAGSCDLMLKSMGNAGSPTDVFMLSPLADF